MISQLKNSEMLPIMLVSIVLIASDLSNRVLSFLSEEVYPEPLDLIELHKRPVLTNERYDVILSAMPSLTDSVVDEKESVVIAPSQSVEERLAGYTKIGEFNYRLVAVFVSDEQFAVLERRNDDESDSQIVKVFLGDAVNNMSVTSIGNNSIELENAVNFTLLLSLFEPESA